MSHSRMENIGAALGIAAGGVFLPIALYAGPFFLLFGITEFGGTYALKPLIGPGWSSILHASSVLAGGLLAVRWPWLGGAVLLLCALAGLLFGTSKYPVLECLALIGGTLCLFGWWQRRSALRMHA